MQEDSAVMSSLRLRDMFAPEDPGPDSLQVADSQPASLLTTHTTSDEPELPQSLQERLLAAINPLQARQLSEPELRRQLQQLADDWARHDPDSVDFHERENAVNAVVDDIHGLGPISGLIRENDISEILINGPRQVFFERRGQLSKSEVVFRNEAHLSAIIGRLIEGTGRRVDKSSPMLDVRLHDGSRMNVVLNPPALNGPLVSIRRFGARPLTVDDLLANEALTREMLDFLAACVKSRINILISGGTGSGKTTLLNALSRYISSAERVVTIEDTAELELQQPHVAKLESQPPDLDGEGQVTMRDLVRNSLRMRPDRIIIGECRGGEAFEMLQAMSTGHEGSMTTIHAGNPRESISRLELIVALAGMDLPVWAVRKLISSCINVIVQASRLPGGKRRITSITEIAGMEGDTIAMQEIFTFVRTGVNQELGAEGYHSATGIRPNLLKKLQVSGAGVPVELFTERRFPSPSSRGSNR
jgi:pilus assembly protein CpaF